jgi:hypothetical protein
LLDVAVGVIDADKPVSVYVDVARVSIVESSAITTCNIFPALGAVSVSTVPVLAGKVKVFVPATAGADMVSSPECHLAI